MGLTYVASKQAGAAAQEAKDTASFKAYDAQATAVITELQNRVAAAGQTPQTPGANGADPSTATPNADGTTQTAPGTTDPGATTPGTNAQASPGGAGSEIPPNIIVAVPPKAVPSGSVAAGAWNPSTLIGSSMQLPAGQGANASTPLAAAGTFVVQTPVGDVNGYATAAEANAAAKAPIDTTSSGLPYLRFVVVQHGGRYYAALAKATDGSPSKPLDAATGTVASWHAAQYVSGGSGGSWQVYTWDQQAGASAVDVGYTPEPFAPGATGSTNATGQSTISGGPAPGVPAPGTPGVPTPGSAPTIGSAPAPGTTPGVANPSAAAAPFDPSSVIGASFALNAASTAEGDIVRGGSLQVQSFVSSSTGGFGTAEDAAVAARAERAAIGTDPWKRIVTVQGADNRFYVYTGSIVSRATQAPSGAAPVHVFASGVAEYFDGATASWKAVRDNK
ncbi:MAG: hypothetical protein JWN41_299 [Thermoleophilia bacterium]|nr:hypothetical protein [Thermoleophilia bacterium]